MIDKEVVVIGAGLAGSEAAWQIANAGIAVKLVEMRPLSSTPAHHSDDFGQLIISFLLRKIKNNMTNGTNLPCP